MNGVRQVCLCRNLIIVKDSVNPVFPIPHDLVITLPLEIENAVLLNEVLFSRIYFPGIERDLQNTKETIQVPDNIIGPVEPRIPDKSIQNFYTDEICVSL